MRGAPPVHMACGRDARWGAGVTLLAGLATATLAWWAGRHLGGSMAVCGSAGVGAGLLGAFCVARALRRAVSRQLLWDGRAWLLDGGAGQVGVMIDLGHWMLLRFDAHAPQPGLRPVRVQWLPVTLGVASAAPHLCRAALHAEAGLPGRGA